MKEKTTRYYRNELKKLKEKIRLLEERESAYKTAMYYLGGNAK